MQGTQRKNKKKLQMNYYQAPYMSVLIRCYERGLPESGIVPAELLNLDILEIKKSCKEVAQLITKQQINITF